MTIRGIYWQRSMACRGSSRAASEESGRVDHYFAANLDEDTRKKLIEEKRHSAEELRPFSPEGLEKVAAAFAARCKASVRKPSLPASAAEIDLRNIEFELAAFFDGYLFSTHANFDNATFSNDAN